MAMFHARRRHVVDESVDLGSRARSRHDRERRPVRDRALEALVSAAFILIGSKIAT